MRRTRMPGAMQRRLVHRRSQVLQDRGGGYGMYELRISGPGPKSMGEANLLRLAEGVQGDRLWQATFARQHGKRKSGCCRLLHRVALRSGPMLRQGAPPASPCVCRGGPVLQTCRGRGPAALRPRHKGGWECWGMGAVVGVPPRLQCGVSYEDLCIYAQQV